MPSECPGSGPRSRWRRHLFPLSRNPTQLASRIWPFRPTRSPRICDASNSCSRLRGCIYKKTNMFPHITYYITYRSLDRFFVSNSRKHCNFLPKYFEKAEDPVYFKIFWSLTVMCVVCTDYQIGWVFKFYKNNDCPGRRRKGSLNNSTYWTQKKMRSEKNANHRDFIQFSSPINCMDHSLGIVLYSGSRIFSREGGWI